MLHYLTFGGTSWITLTLLLLLIQWQAATPCLAFVDTMPERLRGGSVYKEARLALETQTSSTLGVNFKGAHKGSVPLRQNKTVNYFDQLIDHPFEKRANQKGPLRKSNKKSKTSSSYYSRTFKQRWWIDTSGWDGVTPRAMLYIHGEGAASSTPGGYAQQYAHQSNSVIFALEHRFYGESLIGPLSNRSLLKYLTVENALADLRYFRDAMTEQYFPNVKEEDMQWYAVGGSYPGALAVWLRETYPDSFTAAWSSSGVVQSIFDFYQFDHHLVKVLSRNCVENLQAIFSYFASIYEVSPTMARAEIDVPDYFTREDIAWMLVDGAAMAVQYGKKSSFCDALVGENGQGRISLQEYVQLLRTLWGNDFPSSCYYSSECLSNPDFKEQWGASYAWVYQCCSQLAYWQIGYPNSLRLEMINSSYFINQCRNAYGGDVFPDTYKFNNNYGGAYPYTNRVVALQGSDDPWVPAGVSESLGEDYPAFTASCDGCGHCGDLHAPSPQDHRSLTRQRELLTTYLNRWLGVEEKKTF